MKKSVLAGVCAFLIAAAGVMFAAAQPPARNVNPGRHPHLARAQQMARNAYNQVLAAQKANEWDLGGHAQRAKELLDQVNNELKQAAEVSNANH